MRKAQVTAAIAAAVASLASVGVAQAQEANAWEVEQLTGRSQTRSLAQLSREQVVAELQQARAEGTYHAGNEGSVPQVVLDRRIIAAQREGQRIARAYEEEAARVARMNAQREAAAPRMPSAAETTVIATPVQSSGTVVAVPAEPSAPAEPVQPQPAAAPSTAATTRPATPNDTGTPPTPDVRPNEDMASGERRTPPDATSNTVPPRGDAPPVAPGSEAAQPGTPPPQPSGDASPATRIEQQAPAPQETRSIPSATR